MERKKKENIKLPRHQELFLLFAPSAMYTAFALIWICSLYEISSCCIRIWQDYNNTMFYAYSYNIFFVSHRMIHLWSKMVFFIDKTTFLWFGLSADLIVSCSLTIALALPFVDVNFINRQAMKDMSIFKYRYIWCATLVTIFYFYVFIENLFS